MKLQLSLEFNHLKKISKQWMLITAGDEKKSNTMTASWEVLVLCGERMLQPHISDQTVIQKEFVDQTDLYVIISPGGGRKR